jgi:hypothetical protein
MLAEIVTISPALENKGGFSLREESALGMTGSCEAAPDGAVLLCEERRPGEWRCRPK